MILWPPPFLILEGAMAPWPLPKYAYVYTYQGPDRLVYRMSHLVSLPEAKELLRTDIMISRHGP